jgi:hypothetical protein
MDTDGRFPTPTTRRTIVATGAKLTYAAPLVATSLKLSAMNAAAAVSLGSLCAAGSVFFSRIGFGDDTGGVVFRPACCSCVPPSGSPVVGTCAACTLVDPGTGLPECRRCPTGTEEGPCFVSCSPVP